MVVWYMVVWWTVMLLGLCTSVTVSGRSSAYGDTAPEGGLASVRSETSSVGMASGMGATEHYADDGVDADMDTGRKLHSLRVLLQTRMIDHIPHLKQVGGIRARPFMQVRTAFP